MTVVKRVVPLTLRRPARRFCWAYAIEEFGVDLAAAVEVARLTLGSND